jgi:phage terminase large subunit GpA-like protein
MEIPSSVAIDLDLDLPDVFYEPEPWLTVSEWADKHRILSSRSAAEPGQYRTSRTPYLKDIMDDLSARSPVRTVVFKKAAQVGASEAGSNWVGYIIDQAPGPVMLVQPTTDLAKRFSRQRIETLIDTCERVKTKVAVSKSRDSSNTQLVKDFAGGILVITGANSAVGLRSMPVRYLMLDEVDAYPADVDDEGSPIQLAEARTRTFGARAKILLASTPRMKGSSVIERAYEAGDQRKYFVPCPHCETMQTLDFDRLKWPPGKYDDVAYQCVACETLFPEFHKTAMFAAGEWRVTRESNDPYTHSYFLSGLYSPLGWLGWSDIARMWEAAADDADARKAFTNTVLGETWSEEADAIPDWQRLYERREEWAHQVVPMRGLFLTAGADVQGDRVEVFVWAWGRQLESWLVDHIVITGDPGAAATWLAVSEVTGRTWEHESGRRMGLQRFAIDTGGYTSSVYNWARLQDRSVILPVKGMAAYDRLVPVNGPTRVEVLPNGERIKRGLNLWTVSTSFFKKELYRHLNLVKPTDEQIAAGLRYPAGYVHLSTGCGEEAIKQLVSEQQIIVRSRTGYSVKTEWRQLRARNEAMDCRVYARAAVWLAGADRWSEAKWQSLEQQLGLTPPTTARVEPPSAGLVVRQMITEEQIAPLSVSEIMAAPPNAEMGGMIARKITRRRVRY